MDFNPFSLENKNIIITGASSGIGQQCAIDFAKLGANVILIGRNEDRLQETLSYMPRQGNHLIFKNDLNESGKAAEIIDFTVKRIGLLDGILNCAGISSVTPLNLLKEDIIDSFFNTNVKIGILLSKEFARKKNHNPNGGSIVFVASIMGIVGDKAKTIYSATKGALISMSRSMAIELADKNIRVNCISPGIVETPINKNADYLKNPNKRILTELKHPLGIGKTHFISLPAAFLFTDASKWITGQNIVIDGGYTAL